MEAIDDIEQYLQQHQNKELLRFVAVGSVDDGKSTLIGRLLHDTKGVYEDQLKAVKKATNQNDMEIDFSLFTDGLKAEREQGITIDVAYRYFSTSERKFIIADTPGHVQYTRNMATGASTANVAIILIDARLGVLQQSRRHAYIASLLGIPHLAVAVNKMDLRDHDQGVYDAIVKEFTEFAKELSFKDVTFIPISAKNGDNVVHDSTLMPWFKGGTLLSYLEKVPIALDRNSTDFRFAVQNVLRPNLNYRGFAGEVGSGVVKKGDTVMVLPSRKTSIVEGIDTFSGELESAGPCSAIAIRLKDEIDISRGDMLVHPTCVPEVARRVEADIVWMSEKPLDPNKSYLLKQTTRTIRTDIDEVLSVTDLEESLQNKNADTLQLNDIGRIRLACHTPLFFDAYETNRATGAFILIDSMTNNTVAAGMIVGAAAGQSIAPGKGSTAPGGAGQVSQLERNEVLGQAGAVVVVSGKQASAAAYAIERALYDRRRPATVVAEDDAITAAPLSVEAATSLALRLTQLGAITLIADTALAPQATSTLVSALQKRLGAEHVLSATLEADCWLLDGKKTAPHGAQLDGAASAMVAALEGRKLFGDKE